MKKYDKPLSYTFEATVETDALKEIMARLNTEAQKWVCIRMPNRRRRKKIAKAFFGKKLIRAGFAVRLPRVMYVKLDDICDADYIHAIFRAAHPDVRFEDTPDCVRFNTMKRIPKWNNE